MSEKSLHADLKSWYARPDDQLEAPIDGYVIDIVRGDLLIEIQTRSFSAIKEKLWKLVGSHQVRLVYPIASEKWLLKRSTKKGERPKRRKSPKRGSFEDLFVELVSFPTLFLEPNFSLEVLMIQEEEVRHHDPRRAWRRRGWVTDERRLLKVVDKHRFEDPIDLMRFLPDNLPVQFTTADLAAALGKPRRIAQRMAYCLRHMGAIEDLGREGRAILYARADIARGGGG